MTIRLYADRKSLPLDRVTVTLRHSKIYAKDCSECETREGMLDQMKDVTEYALTGAVIARDRTAIARATEVLRFSAGNFYINDKPTGAVVGQQPFGGARASGTNDKAGSKANLMRWTSTRTIKETFVPPTDSAYSHIASDATETD